jgi:hypothetical protein
MVTKFIDVFDNLLYGKSYSNSSCTAEIFDSKDTNAIHLPIRAVINTNGSHLIRIEGYKSQYRLRIPIIHRFIRFTNFVDPSFIKISWDRPYGNQGNFIAVCSMEFINVRNIEGDIRKAFSGLLLSKKERDYIIETIYDLFEPFSLI